MESYVKQYFINEVECFIRASNHEKLKLMKARAEGRVLLLFSSILEILMKHEARVHEMASQMGLINN